MGATTAQFQVTGMTCGHCEMSVREEVGGIPGVQGVEVSHETGVLRISAQQPVDEDAVLAAVAEAGYSAVRDR
ncbi:heavy-metal-associated domain-containing protein [Brachybacterium sp. AOP43-C2-M15]|uniref:heavy-metal-associated domain-containing protein n=1 Tax=Brachybacterium sp. AOP43-C2-M15 TaxID=3457661 RepID=UPI0040332687